jgi:DNA-directed RNA polymerase subunit F
MIDELFSNPILTDVILSKMKKMFKKNKIKCVSIIPTDNDELDFKVYKDDVVVVKKELLEQILEKLNKKENENI